MLSQEILVLLPGVLFLTALNIMLFSDWRLLILFLMLQYGGVTVLIAQSWPLSISLVKLIAGVMGSSMLGLSFRSGQLSDSPGPAEAPPARVFRGFTAVLVGVSVVSFLGEAQEWFLGASREQITGGLLLIGLGLIHAALSEQPFRIIIGLLTLVSGFEILYATVEGSILMTAFLGALNLGIAFVGSYLLSLEGEESR